MKDSLLLWQKHFNFRYEKIVQLLVQYGGKVNVYNADIKSSPLYHAVALGSLQATSCLLGAGAELEHVTTSMGETVLHVAASTGSAEIVSLLLKKGANTLVNFVTQVTFLYYYVYKFLMKPVF